MPHGLRLLPWLRKSAFAAHQLRTGGRALAPLGMNLILFLQMLGVCYAGTRNVLAPLPVEGALHVKEIAPLLPLALSPDGKWLAYTVHDRWISGPSSLENYLRTGVPPWASGTHIELTDLKSKQSENLIGSGSDSWLPCWSPDGRWLAFLSNRASAQAQLWIWDRRSGQFRRLSTLGMRTDRIVWTQDSDHLVVTAAPAAVSRESTLSAAWARQTRRSSPLIYWSGSLASPEDSSPVPHAWNLDEYRRDLIMVDRRNGQVTPLVSGRRIMAYSVAPDDSLMAYTQPMQFSSPASQQILFDLRAVALSGRDDRVIAARLPMEYDGSAFSWSPESSQLAFCTGGMDVRSADCFVADLRSGTLRNVTSFSAAQAGGAGDSKPLWDAQGHIYFLRNGELWRSSIRARNAAPVAAVPKHRIVSLIPWKGNMLWQLKGGGTTIVVTHDDSEKQDGFYSVSLEAGNVRKRLEDGQCYTCSGLSPSITVSADGRSLAYVAEDAAHEPDLWTATASVAMPSRLTHLNPQFERYKLGAAQLVQWRDDDGNILHGSLLLPADYRQGKRYPLLVWVYGGARLSDDLDHFGLGGNGPFNMQMFATRGYAVFWPDAPLPVGRPFAGLAQTVLPGINKVIEMGVADPQHLGLMGHSYGGFSVLSLIVQTGRFEAAAEIDGFADLIGVYGEMSQDGSAFGVASMEKGQGLMEASPWQMRDRYLENSPFFYLNRVSAPLLIVHGGDDETVSPFLGDEIFVALRRLGKPAEYVKYESEGHSPLQWSFADQGDLCRRLIAWFASYLRN